MVPGSSPGRGGGHSGVLRPASVLNSIKIPDSIWDFDFSSFASGSTLGIFYLRFLLPFPYRGWLGERAGIFFGGIEKAPVLDDTDDIEFTDNLIIPESKLPNVQAESNNLSEKNGNGDVIEEFFKENLPKYREEDKSRLDIPAFIRKKLKEL